MSDFESKMSSAVIHYEKELNTLRTSRANPSMLDSIFVDAYGSKTPLNQLGSVSAQDASTIMIQIWDTSLIKAIENAITESNLGINPQVDGQIIRLPIPDLSEERRKEMVKVAGKYAEASRVAIRNIRRDAIEAVRKAEKEGGMSEDERHGLENEAQKLTDSHISKVDDMLAKKEKDILSV